MRIIMNILLLSCTLLMAESLGCQVYIDKVYNGSFADCSRRNLSRIPTDLPANTTSLDLSKNNISVLKVCSNFTLKRLKYLDISHNWLKSLDSESFAYFHELQELYLHNNYLTLDNMSYPPDVFQPLQNLVKLHIQSNDERDEGSYPEDEIGKLRRITELKIDSFSKTYFGYGFAKLFNLRSLILGFRGCKLQRIQNRTFENLSNISLVLIDLDYCPVIIVEVGSFIPLKSLKHLYMSNVERVGPSTAVLAMYGLRGRNLSSVQMNKIFCDMNFRYETLAVRVLSNDVLKYLKDICIEKFTMINNQLLWFGSVILDGTTFGKCIKYLDLSLNDFYGDVNYMHKLSLLPNLVYLNLSTHARGRSRSTIDNVCLSKSTLSLPDTLEVLNYDGFDVGYKLFVNGINFYAKSLRYFSFASNGLTMSSSESRITGLENLTFCDFSGNNFSDMNPSFFNDFPNLEYLKISDVNLRENYLLNDGNHLFHRMQKLKYINLHNNDFRLMDTNIFRSNLVEKVILSQNRFESIPFDMTTTPHLKYLDLSFNSLAILSETEMTLLDDLASRNNLTLNLYGNLLSCGCYNLDFILWLYTTNVHVMHGSTYICQMSDGTITNTSYIRDHYEEIWMTCNGRMSLSISVALLAISILFIVAMYFTVKRKTLLVNILLRMFGYGPLPSPLLRDNFINDAYMGYSDVDYQYICHTVRDHLENRHGLKLFIRDRDTVPGGEIADDIINGIDSSWRTVLFLSAAFLNDQWCQFTFNRVIYSSARMPSGSIILVLCDDITRGDIDPALLNVVVERNIFYVEKYREDDDQLWKDIADRIKENITT